MWSLVGVLMILRGLGLGIPYLSPPDQALQIRSEIDTEMMHHLPENPMQIMPHLAINSEISTYI